MQKDICCTLRFEAQVWSICYYYPAIYIQSNSLCFAVSLVTELFTTGSGNTVGNVSGYECVSDCRSRGCEFAPGPVLFFIEIDHETISSVILLLSADAFKKGCCQLQAKVCAQITG